MVDGMGCSGARRGIVACACAGSVCGSASSASADSADHADNAREPDDAEPDAFGDVREPDAFGDARDPDAGDARDPGDDRRGRADAC
jgi:hypothetical protein